MKNDVKKIGWLLLLGQLLFQGTVFMVAFAAILLGLGDKATIIGSCIGSFLANVVIFGIFKYSLFVDAAINYMINSKRTDFAWKSWHRCGLILPFF